MEIGTRFADVEEDEEDDAEEKEVVGDEPSWKVTWSANLATIPCFRRRASRKRVARARARDSM